MVLSNKKQKQKLRALTLEALEKAETPCAGDGRQKLEEAKKELESLKEELKARRNLKRRPRRRNKRRSEEDGVEEDGEGSKIEEEKETKRNGADDDEEEKTRSERREEKRRKKEEKKKRKEMERVGKVNRRGAGEVEMTDCGKEGACGGEEKSVEKLKVEEREGNGDPGNKVYVGGIPYYSTEDDIRGFFQSCGTITEVDCMTFPDNGKFRGIAILTFKTNISVKKALSMDGVDMGGLYLKIRPYKSTRSTRKDGKSDFSPEVIEGYNRIYAGNLSWDITEDDLRKLLSDCSISSIRFGEDKETGEFKGYAHVDFADSVSHSIALKLDQNVVRGRPVRIRCAVPLTTENGGNEFKSNANRASKLKSNGNGVNLLKDNVKEVSLDFKRVSESTATENSLSSSKKKKRRTCYECGVPGHLASECPQKRSANAAHANGQC